MSFLNQPLGHGRRESGSSDDTSAKLSPPTKPANQLIGNEESLNPCQDVEIDSINNPQDFFPSELENSNFEDNMWGRDLQVEHMSTELTFDPNRVPDLVPGPSVFENTELRQSYHYPGNVGLASTRGLGIDTGSQASPLSDPLSTFTNLADRAEEGIAAIRNITPPQHIGYGNLVDGDNAQNINSTIPNIATSDHLKSNQQNNRMTGPGNWEIHHDQQHRMNHYQRKRDLPQEVDQASFYPEAPLENQPQPFSYREAPIQHQASRSTSQSTKIPNQKSTRKPQQSTKTQVADNLNVNTSVFTVQPQHSALVSGGSSGGRPAAKDVRKARSGEEVDRPAVSTISSNITKLRGGWSPALYGEQPLKLDTVLSDPSTDETLREDCLEIFHVLSQMTRGESEYLPWFNQVEQYISKPDEELDAFASHIGYEGAAAKYLTQRRAREAEFRGICERLEAEQAGQAGQAHQAVGQVGLVGQAENLRPNPAARSRSGPMRVCRV
ncbi:hypothetical protein M7I_1457 [Glarea lozoyensis 74030]|uniref:Uncharacterized protein n=1 Tax=Glarea lozoyensis (strain ATCC 74030 / MF5533) TaxID=1104152 RepID=H0EG49_GLAL7|nr:hypothetical protein M7I_1457 [Glarea lozoyensis 74030]